MEHEIVAAQDGPGLGGTAEQPAAAKQAKPLVHFTSKGCTHALKLRDCLKLDAQIQLEFGLDFCLAPGASHDARSLLRSAAPWLAVQRQLDPADQGLGVLRADLHHLSFTRRFHLLAPKGARWSLPVDLKVGKSYDARPPHVGVQFGDWRVTLSLAALLLATGKPVHLSHREVGPPALHFPLYFGGARHKEALTERVEVDATLQRRGRWLAVDVHQLNGVLRLREE